MEIEGANDTDPNTPNPPVDIDSTPDGNNNNCLLYTSDAADERSSVDLGGRRIIKKKKTQ